MNKFLRREAAFRCPVHQGIMAEAIKQLGLHGCFSKEKVLDSTSFSAMSDAIRWDYIREFIESETGICLTPVSEAFFNKKQHEESVTKSAFERLIATGYGKKTAGYANATMYEGRVAIQALRQRYSQALGAVSAAEKGRARLSSVGIAYQEKALIENKG